MSVRTELPSCAPGLGHIITSVNSPELIDGVLVEDAALWPDDRGWFQEIFRFGRGLTQRYPAATTQVSSAVSFPSIIKAFHLHHFQTDVWVPILGTFQVALADLRPDSPTYGQKNTFYIGEHRSWRLLIPPGVAHGYKIVSPGSGVLVYATDRFYDPADEGRIAHDHPALAYDCATQHK